MHCGMWFLSIYCEFELIGKIGLIESVSNYKEDMQGITYFINMEIMHATICNKSNGVKLIQY